MVITSFTQEFACQVPPARMFKALILDFHNLMPKLMPQAIHSIQIIEGDGGVGSIKKTNFAQGSHFKYMNHRIDALDKEKFMCKYSLIEGDMLGEHVEFISYEVKFETSGDGGCVCKMTSEYHTVGDFQIKEEEIKGGKEKAMAMYKVIEAYLLGNPEVYA